MSNVNKYLDVFPEASPAHARSIMSTPGRNSPETVYLSVDKLPQRALSPGDPGYHWLSLAVDSGVPASANITAELILSQREREPLVNWDCGFTLSPENTETTQARVDALLSQYHAAGFKMSPSRSISAAQDRTFTTDLNFLKVALSEKHREQADLPEGTIPLLPDEPVQIFTLGDLEVRVRMYRPPRPMGLKDVLRAIRGR